MTVTRKNRGIAFRNHRETSGKQARSERMLYAIARSCIRSGDRRRFYNVVDLVNRPAHCSLRWSGVLEDWMGPDLKVLQPGEPAQFSPVGLNDLAARGRSPKKNGPQHR